MRVDGRPDCVRHLVDVRTGALIIDNCDVRAVQMVGNGIVGTGVQAAIDSASGQSPADKLIDIYGANYRQWLLRLAS